MYRYLENDDLASGLLLLLPVSPHLRVQRNPLHLRPASSPGEAPPPHSSCRKNPASRGTSFQRRAALRLRPPHPLLVLHPGSRPDLRLCPVSVSITQSALVAHPPCRATLVFLPMQIEKVYEPQRFEPHWAQWWIDSGIFQAAGRGAAPVFSLVIPPPNVTGALHIGHMLEHTEIRRRSIACVSNRARIVHPPRDRGAPGSGVACTPARPASVFP